MRMKEFRAEVNGKQSVIKLMDGWSFFIVYFHHVEDIVGHPPLVAPGRLIAFFILTPTLQSLTKSIIY